MYDQWSPEEEAIDSYRWYFKDGDHKRAIFIEASNGVVDYRAWRKDGADWIATTGEMELGDLMDASAPHRGLAKEDLCHGLKVFLFSLTKEEQDESVLGAVLSALAAGYGDDEIVGGNWE